MVDWGVWLPLEGGDPADYGASRPLRSVNRRPSPDLLDWKLLTLYGWNRLLTSDLSGGRRASIGRVGEPDSGQEGRRLGRPRWA